MLEERFMSAGAIKPRDLGGGSDDDEDDKADEKRELAERKRSALYSGARRSQLDADDESSDFSD